MSSMKAMSGMTATHASMCPSCGKKRHVATGYRCECGRATVVGAYYTTAYWAVGTTTLARYAEPIKEQAVSVSTVAGPSCARCSSTHNVRHVQWAGARGLSLCRTCEPWNVAERMGVRDGNLLASHVHAALDVLASLGWEEGTDPALMPKGKATARGEGAVTSRVRQLARSLFVTDARVMALVDRVTDAGAKPRAPSADTSAARQRAVGIAWRRERGVRHECLRRAVAMVRVEAGR